MPSFRFTMNVSIIGVSDPVFEKVAGSLLDRLLERQASEGMLTHTRVLGRVDQKLLKVILEFEASGHNGAHTYGFGLTAHCFERMGADVSSWFEQPHVAVTVDDGTNWDVLVEELKTARLTPAESRVEQLVPA